MAKPKLKPKKKNILMSPRELGAYKDHVLPKKKKTLKKKRRRRVMGA